MLELDAPGAPEFEPCPAPAAPELLDELELPDCAEAKPIALTSAIVPIDVAMDFIEIMICLLK